MHMNDDDMRHSNADRDSIEAHESRVCVPFKLFFRNETRCFRVSQCNILK